LLLLKLLIPAEYMPGGRGHRKLALFRMRKFYIIILLMGIRGSWIAVTFWISLATHFMFHFFC